MGERRSPQARPLPAAEISHGEVITLANGHHLGFAQYGGSDGKPGSSFTVRPAPACSAVASAQPHADTVYASSSSC
jgi:hypothetical protein